MPTKTKPHNPAPAMVDAWQDARAALADPAYRRDVCFICEDAPRQVNVPGSPVGVCRACDRQARQ